MEIKETKEMLRKELKIAIKGGKKEVKAVISTVSAKLDAAFKEAFLKGKEFKEEDIIQVFSQELKQVKESLDGAIKAERNESIEEARIQIEFLEKFLPKQLNKEEIEKELLLIIENLGLEVDKLTPRDMGKIMKEASPIFKGRANGKEVSNSVSELIKK